jgi:hypothetical protein
MSLLWQWQGCGTGLVKKIRSGCDEKDFFDFSVTL